MAFAPLDCSLDFQFKLQTLALECWHHLRVVSIEPAGST